MEPVLAVAVAEEQTDTVLGVRQRVLVGVRPAGRQRPGVERLGLLAGERVQAQTGRLQVRHRLTLRRYSREDGQRSTSTQSSHRGARAMHTRRPCQISRCGKIPHSPRGTSR